MKYSDCNLLPVIKKNLNSINFNEMTKIQELAIPLALKHKNLIGLAQTGSGKTAAFLLPIINMLINDKNKNKLPRALVLAPTRDLVYQIFENFLLYSKNTNLHAVCIYGGVGYEQQINYIKKGVDIVFANTGRLLDLVEKRKILNLNAIKYLVLDEADQMLDMGFSNDIIRINQILNKQKQIFFFSATMPESVKSLINQIFNDQKYEIINALEKNNINDLIKQDIYLINHQKRNSVLIDLLKKYLINNKQSIIFCRTKKETNDIYNLLKDLKFNVDCLHSNRSQQSRVRALKNFKNFNTEILVATNIAARGIDINNLELVFNYNLPDDDETFIHRIGRTGRKGNKGLAITLISPKELYRLKRIEELLKTKIYVIKNEQYLSKNIDQKIDQYHGYRNIKNNHQQKYKKNNKINWNFKNRK